MAKKKGTGLMMVAADIPADMEEEFNKFKPNLMMDT